MEYGSLKMQNLMLISDSPKKAAKKCFRKMLRTFKLLLYDLFAAFQRIPINVKFSIFLLILSHCMAGTGRGGGGGGRF
jgi:hypothetical protein